MKKFTYLAFLGIMAFGACKKAEIDMDASNSSNSSASNDFGWNGEAPFSVKNNGTYYHGTTAATASSNGVQVVVSMDSTIGGYTIAFPATATPGSTYSLVSNDTRSIIYTNFENIQFPKVFMSSTGKVRIVQNDNQFVSGYFYATVKMVDTSGMVNTRSLTEGYFKVAK